VKAAALDNPLTSTTLCKFGHEQTPASRSCGRCAACHRRASREAMIRLRARRRVAAGTDSERLAAAELSSSPRPAPGTVAAAVYCQAGLVPTGYRDGNVIVRFADLDAAAAFAGTIPCGNKSCTGLHLLVWRDDAAAVRVRIVGGRAPLPLAEELRELYPRRRRPEPRGAGPSPEAWPTPPELNPPPDPATVAGPIAESYARQERRVGYSR
jgi:hypothetical protein